MKNIINYFKSHKDFIKGHQLINHYDQLPSSSTYLPAFIRSFYQGSELYPLLAFKNKIEKDKKDNQEEIIALERNIARQTDPEIIQVLGGMLGSLWDKTRMLDLEQDDLRVLTDIHEQQQKYKRHITVENTLVKAL